jgi:hypothetical protein
VIDLFPVNAGGLPAFPQDALPLAGQRPPRGVRAAALVALRAVLGRRPPAVQDRFLGVVVEALADEFGAEVAAVNVTLTAALLGDGRDPGETLEVGGVSKTVALRTPTGQEPGSQDRAGAGQSVGDQVIGVLAESAVGSC